MGFSDDRMISGHNPTFSSLGAVLPTTVQHQKMVGTCIHQRNAKGANVRVVKWKFPTVQISHPLLKQKVVDNSSHISKVQKLMHAQSNYS